MYKFMVTMAAGQNMTHGSTMSPPRLQQLQEACKEYFSIFTCSTDPLFALWGPNIAKAMGKDPSMAGAMEEIYQSLKVSELLQKKGERVNSPTAKAGRSVTGLGPKDIARVAVMYE